MSIDDVAKLVDSLAKLLGVLVWPLLIGVLLVRIWPSVRDFLANLSEFTLKGGGIEASAKRKQAEVTSALVAASVARPDAAADPVKAGQEARKAADVVAESVSPRMLRRARIAQALWVDDQPENNVFARQSLEALGLTFTLARSTEEALEAIRRQKFDVIISDMDRAPDHQAGYTLLAKLRDAGDRTPYIISSLGGDAPEQKAEARRRGALGSTSRAIELFAYVLSAIDQAA